MVLGFLHDAVPEILTQKAGSVEAYLTARHSRKLYLQSEKLQSSSCCRFEFYEQVHIAVRGEVTPSIEPKRASLRILFLLQNSAIFFSGMSIPARFIDVSSKSVMACCSQPVRSDAGKADKGLLNKKSTQKCGFSANFPIDT